MGGLMQFFQSLGQGTATTGETVGQIAGQGAQAAQAASTGATAAQGAGQASSAVETATKALKGAQQLSGSLGSSSGTSAPMTPARFVPQNKSTGMPGQLPAGPQTRETFMQKMFGDYKDAWKPQKAIQVPLRVGGDLGGATKAMNRASNAAQSAAQTAGRSPVAPNMSFAAQPNMTAANGIGQAVPANPQADAVRAASPIPSAARQFMAMPADPNVPAAPGGKVPTAMDNFMAKVNRYGRGINPDGTPAGSSTEQFIRFAANQAQGYMHPGQAGQGVSPVEVHVQQSQEDPNAPSLLEMLMQLLQANSPGGAPPPTGTDAGAKRG